MPVGDRQANRHPPFETPDQRGDQALLRRQLGLRLHVAAGLLAHLGDRDLDQVAHDAFHVAADIADLGEFRGLHFQEWRLRQFRQTARDLGLADAGRPDHQDVLRQHLLAQLVVELQPPPAIAKRNRDRALRVVLADDEAIEHHVTDNQHGQTGEAVDEIACARRREGRQPHEAAMTVEGRMTANGRTRMMSAAKRTERNSRKSRKKIFRFVW